MKTASFTDLDALLAAPPLDLGATGWVDVAEEEVARFEAATAGPASGFLALSLTNRFLPQLLAVPGASSGVNYGAEEVRFGPAVRAGERVRATAAIVAAAEVPGGVQTTIEISIEVEGNEEPACVVRSLSRWLR